MQTLKQYLGERNLPKKDFAKTVGISQAYLSQILSGDRTPSLRVALDIQSATDGRVMLASLLKQDKGAA